MAEFYFYCSATESESLAQLIISKFHLRVSPNLNFESKFPASYTRWCEALNVALVVNPVLYVMADFVAWPPAMLELQKGKYVGSRIIDLDRSPDVLRITFPNIKSRNDGSRFLPSSLYIPRKYSYKSDFIAPSEPAKHLYTEIVKFIKITLSKERGGSWMGDEVRRSLQCGSGLILKDGQWVGKPMGSGH